MFLFRPLTKRVIFLTLFTTLSLMSRAQVDPNVFIRVFPGSFTANTEPEKEPSTAKTIIGALVNAPEYQSHPEEIDNVKAALMGAIGEVRRFNVTEDPFQPEALEGDEPALVFDCTIGTVGVSSTVSEVKASEERSKVTETKESTGVKAKTQSVTETEKQNSYMASVNAVVNFKDARTGTIDKSIKLNSSTMLIQYGSTPQEAIGYTLETIAKNLKKQLNDSYPVYANIIEGDRVKKDKQKEVYIDLGDIHRVNKGLNFKVFTFKTVAGREARKEIGRLRIEEVMGDDISLCKVTKGGVDIKAALDAGEPLIIISYE